MITVTQGFRSRTFPNDQLANICLKATGGGWTAKQTTDAALLQSKIKTTGRAVLKRASGDITIEIKED